MVGMFGEDWATQELSQLQPKLRKSPLKGVAKGTTPQNALPLLFAAEHALLKLANNIEPWADTVRDAIFATHNKIDEVVTREAQGALSSGEWEAVVGGGGVHFDDGERVEWAMTNVLRGVREEWAPSLYQARSTLPDATLSDCFIDPRIVHSPIRKHPTEPNTPLLEATSHIRVQVEQTRIELLRWLGKRWLSVRQAKGFDPLEEWSLKEISDCKCALIIFFSLFLTTSRYRSAHLRLPLPPSYSSPAKRTPTHLRPVSAHPHTSKAGAPSDGASSMRASALSRIAGTYSSAAATGVFPTPALRLPGSCSGTVASSIAVSRFFASSGVQKHRRRHFPSNLLPAAPVRPPECAHEQHSLTRSSPPSLEHTRAPTPPQASRGLQWPVAGSSTRCRRPPSAPVRLHEVQYLLISTASPNCLQGRF